MNLANADEFLTEKQKSNKEYYQRHREAIMARTKAYVAEKRELINAKERQKYKKPGKRCLLCVAVLCNRYMVHAYHMLMRQK